MNYATVIQEGIRLSKDRQKPYTPHDLLADLGITDIGEYRSLMTMIHRDLKVGNKHNDLLGRVFVLNQTNRGRPASGFGDNPPTALSERTISFKSKALTVVTEQTPDFTLPTTASEREALLRNAVKLPTTVQKQISAALSSQDAELRIAHRDLAAANRVADSEQKRADEASANAAAWREMAMRLAPQTEEVPGNSLVGAHPQGVHGRA